MKQQLDSPEIVLLKFYWISNLLTLAVINGNQTGEQYSSNGQTNITSLSLELIVKNFQV
jgi:hypothetical protein